MANSKNSSNFELIRKLGSGAFGEIFLGRDSSTQREVAIKLENTETEDPQLFHEARLYLYLLTDTCAPDKGIPRIYYYGTEGRHNVMVMDLLGPSLEDLFELCGRKLSLKTVLMVGEQILSRLEYIHSKYIIHRDVKPHNFLIGQGEKQQQIYIIDFGLSKKYVGKNGHHINYREGKELKGTAKYVSINTHLGIEQSRRDDLESLGYMMIYLLHGSLPWQNIKTSAGYWNYEQILEKKIRTSLEQLCQGSPSEFVAYMSYCRNLKFDEKPNYNYLRSILKDLFVKSGYEWDYEYDWSMSAKENKEKKEEYIKEKMVAEPDATGTPQAMNIEGSGNQPQKIGIQ